jgi:glycosyltransferase involved in cell wall biosynthesis
MCIAQVSPPLESVPPSGYGGTERVVATLTEELVRRGHDVTLFAPGDSCTSARLVPTVERALWHSRRDYPDFAPFWAITLGEVWRRLIEFDVIHAHLDFFGFPLARASARPVITTLHGRLDLPQLEPLFDHFADVPLVSISDAQRTPVPNANWVATVYHGIELDQYTFSPKRGQYLAFLGRIAPEKGIDVAIRVARRAGLPLRIAARKPLPFKNDPEVRKDWEYFENVLKPLLDDSHVDFVGELAGKRKDAFLGHAAALMFPVQWPEPFGLVMAEALACGTPVVALAAGSVPEVIADGVTGFIRTTEDGLVEAVQRIGELDRAGCRAEAERRFSPSAMAEAYEQVYASLPADKRTPAPAAA